MLNMMNKTKDQQIIADLGGVTKVAKLLKYDIEKGGIQRVSNWNSRGRIPAQVKVDFPKLFLNKK